MTTQLDPNKAVDEPRTYTQDEVDAMVKEGKNTLRDDFMSTQGAELKELRAKEDARLKEQEETEEKQRLANSEHETIITELKANTEKLKAEHQAEKSKALQLQIDLHLKAEGMHNELTRKGAATMYDGETPVADWVASLKDSTPDAFTAVEKPLGVGNVQAGNVSSGSGQTITEEQANEWKCAVGNSQEARDKRTSAVQFFKQRRLRGE